MALNFAQVFFVVWTEKMQLYRGIYLEVHLAKLLWGAPVPMKKTGFHSRPQTNEN